MKTNPLRKAAKNKKLFDQVMRESRRSFKRAREIIETNSRAEKKLFEALQG